MQINVLDIIEGTSVDGPGLRTAIYLAGCTHGCKGCHNPQSWDENGGNPTSLETLIQIVKDNDFDVTISGGDPFLHPEQLAELCRHIKTQTGKNIWCYTGYTWQLICNSAKLSEPLKWIDVVVDGPFIEALRNPELLFRGSSNQRLIDVSKSLSTGTISEWLNPFE